MVLAQASYMKQDLMKITEVVASYGKYALFKLPNSDSDEEEYVAMKFRFRGNGKLGKYDKVILFYDEEYMLWYGKHLNSLAEGEQVEMTKEFKSMIMAESL